MSNAEDSDQPLNLNLNYARTKPGLLKILSVILGMLALLLSAYAWDNAIMARPIKGELCDYKYNEKTKGVEEDGSCKVGLISPDDLCEASNKRARLQLKGITDEKLKKDHEKKIRACPSRWLVLPQIFIIGFIWAGTTHALIAAFISQSIARKLRRLDFIGHIVAAVLQILSGVCFLGYTISVIVRDECERFEEQVTRKPNKGGGGGVGVGYGGSGGYRRLGRQPVGCYDQDAENYYHWHVLNAGVWSPLTDCI